MVGHLSNHYSSYTFRFLKIENEFISKHETARLTVEINESMVNEFSNSLHNTIITKIFNGVR